MDDIYHVTLSAASSLSEAESAIQGEEAGGSEFQDNRVITLDLKVTNLVEFKELPSGHPKAISLVKKGEKAPTDKKKIWTGQMVIDNTIQTVRAYR